MANIDPNENKEMEQWSTHLQNEKHRIIGMRYRESIHGNQNLRSKLTEQNKHNRLMCLRWNENNRFVAHFLSSFKKKDDSQTVREQKIPRFIFI